jgi:hypothetical protein
LFRDRRFSARASQKYNRPIVPFPPRFQEDIGGYGKGLEYAFEKIPEIDQKCMLELKEKFLEKYRQDYLRRKKW